MKTILVVDDDEQTCTMLSVALTRNGYRVIEAHSGLDGLRMAQLHLPDLILSDIHMPGGTGSTLLRDIRHDSELKSRQVVLITGRPDLVTPRTGMEDGADDFLVKPVSIDALLKCVKARLDRASISWRVEDQVLAELRTSTPSQLPHEFFTPISGIIGLVEILRSGYSELAAGEVTDILDDVYESALRLNRTLRNYLLILDLPAASSEALLFPQTAIQVEENIRAGVKEALRLNKREEDIRVRISVCSILVKPHDLIRMVDELVDNACKFSRTGSPVEIELNAAGVLTITDQGRGMTEEEISRIGAFRQFDRKKHEQQGLGLGLVLVQKLVAQYDATFLLTSQPGKGTQVVITFARPSKVENG
jgi:two-component system, sensor histidine kinase and response regulator